MAHRFAHRARKVAWSFHNEKSVPQITSIKRVGTDSTLNDEEDNTSVSSCIHRIDEDEHIDRFISALKQDGCVIVEDFADLQSLQNAMEEVKPWKETENTTPLIKQSPTIRNNFFANTVYQDLCEEFLTVETTRWKNDCQNIELCKPTLSSATSRVLQKSSNLTSLVRYDRTLGIKHLSTEKYHHGRDKMLGLIVPGSSAVRVQVALGSHLSGSESPNIILEDELKLREALIVLGSLYYSVIPQAELDTNVEPGLVHHMWSCAGVYRPEESLASMISAAEVRTYPEVVQERLR